MGSKGQSEIRLQRPETTQMICIDTFVVLKLPAKKQMGMIVASGFALWISCLTDFIHSIQLPADLADQDTKKSRRWENIEQNSVRHVISVLKMESPMQNLSS